MQNLREIDWVLPAYAEGKEEFAKREERIFEEAKKEAANP
jgi:hypothetical protein